MFGFCFRRKRQAETAGVGDDEKKRWVGRAAAALMMTPRSCRVGTWAGVATSRQLAASGPTATPAAIYGPRIAATGKRWAVAGSCFGQASGSDSGEQAMGALIAIPPCRSALPLPPSAGAFLAPTYLLLLLETTTRNVSRRTCRALRRTARPSPRDGAGMAAGDAPRSNNAPFVLTRPLRHYTGPAKPARLNGTVHPSPPPNPPN